MSLVEKIKQIYPQLSDEDFIDLIRVMDNADGTPQFIAYWNHPTLAKPTQEQLDGAK